MVGREDRKWRNDGGRKEGRKEGREERREGKGKVKDASSGQIVMEKRKEGKKRGGK